MISCIVDWRWSGGDVSVTFFITVSSRHSTTTPSPVWPTSSLDVVTSASTSVTVALPPASWRTHRGSWVYHWRDWRWTVMSAGTQRYTTESSFYLHIISETVTIQLYYNKGQSNLAKATSLGSCRYLLSCHVVSRSPSKIWSNQKLHRLIRWPWKPQQDSSTSSLLSNPGKKIRTSSGEDKETSFLFQHISGLIQRFNSVLLHDSFTKDNRSGPIAFRTWF